MSTNEPEFPRPIRLRGRLFFDRFDVETYKRALIGLPALERNPKDTIEFVPAKRLKDEIGVNRRTLGRRVAGRVAFGEARS